MDCSSGNSSGSLCEQIVVQNQSSGSEAELKQLMDQRKRKRMQSNRESARRSRMRKQQHLDGLMAQNSVLRAQILELTHRLESLNQILSHINNNDDDEQQQRQQQHNNNFLQDFCDNFDEFDLNPLFINSLFFTPQQQQPPIMASAHHHLLHY
ncbi:hypothetical protein IC582_007313 [Cucumis melo]